MSQFHVPCYNDLANNISSEYDSVTVYQIAYLSNSDSI